jgi:hypothetical protein
MVSNKNEKKPLRENFQNATKTISDMFGAIGGIVHTLCFVFALFLSFRCNGEFKSRDVLFACCCPYIYIAYQLAVNMDKCFPNGFKL